MDQETLVEELRHLGIDVEDHRALLALPLVQVAWTDGDPHPKESEAINAAVVRMQTCQDGEGARMLANWLQHKPSDEYFKRGRDVLVALCIRGTGPGRDIRKDTIDVMLEETRTVAASAGGFLGIGAVSSAERAIINELEKLFGPDFRYNSDDTPWDDPREEMWETGEWEYEDEPVALKLGVKKVEAAMPKRSRGITFDVGARNDDEAVLSEDGE